MLNGQLEAGLLDSFEARLGGGHVIAARQQRGQSVVPLRRGLRGQGDPRAFRTGGYRSVRNDRAGRIGNASGQGGDLGRKRGCKEKQNRERQAIRHTTSKNKRHFCFAPGSYRAR